MDRLLGSKVFFSWAPVLLGARTVVRHGIGERKRSDGADG